MMLKIATVLVVLMACTSAAHRPDMTRVTEWEGTPLLKLESGSERFMEVGYEKCGEGVCPFVNGVCCPDAGVCCEWGRCVEGKTTCSASREQNALVVAKAFAKNEAAEEVLNEQGKKAKTEAGRKLVAESKVKTLQEARIKEQKNDQEDVQKKQSAVEHQKGLDGTIANEEAEKAKESAQKSAARQAIADKLTNGAAQYILQGAAFDVAAKSKQADSVTAKSAYTYTFWLRQKSMLGGWRQIFQRGDKSTQRQPAAWIHNGKLRIEVEQNKGVTVPKALLVGQWEHVAFRADRGRLEVFINGKAAANMKIGEPSSNSGALWASLTRAADAKLADFRIYGTAISTEAIAAIVKEAKFPQVKIGEGVVVLKDGGFELTRGGRITNDRFHHNGAYSMACFVRLLGKTGSLASILHRGSSKTQRQPALHLLPKSTQLEINSQIAGGIKHMFGGKVGLKIGEWTHVAWTHKNGEFAIYVNGNEALKINSPGAPVFSKGAPFFAGNTWDATAPVVVANVAFATDIWTENDVKALMSKHFDRQTMPTPKVLVAEGGTAVNKKRQLASSAVMNGLQRSTARTLTAWIKINKVNTAKDTTILSHNFHPAIVVARTNKIKAYSAVQGKSRFYLQSKEVLRQGAWYHVAIVHYYGHFKLYINGNGAKDKASLSTSRSIPIDGDNNKPLSTSADKAPAADAVVADVRYWPAGLTDDDVWDVYKESKHP